jgi:hypothetical protein
MLKRIVVKSRLPTITEIKRGLPLMREVPSNRYNGSDSLKVWELADGTNIEKLRPNSKHEKPVYVRFLEDGSDKEEFDSLKDVRKFAEKIRKTEAQIRHHDDMLAESAGKEYATEIYHTLNKIYSKKDLRHQLLAAIKKWDSKSSRNEYGAYAYGIVKKLKEYYKRISKK